MHGHGDGMHGQPPVGHTHRNYNNYMPWPACAVRGIIINYNYSARTVSVLHAHIQLV